MSLVKEILGIPFDVCRSRWMDLKGSKVSRDTVIPFTHPSPPPPPPLSLVWRTVMHNLCEVTPSFSFLLLTV